MRLGVFGGTFDPVHLGHLILAEQCREQAALDQVLFVPAARPPNKLDRPLTPFHQRVEMLQLATAGHAAFRVDELEKDRPGPSFTADTLDELKRQHTECELFLLLGSDSLVDLPRWYAPQRIVETASLLIVQRPDWPVSSLEDLRTPLNLPGDFPLRGQLVATPRIEIASRDLRRRAAEGRSLRYFVPRGVECYIVERHLYREQV